MNNIKENKPLNAPSMESRALLKALADGRAYTLKEISHSGKIPADELPPLLNYLIKKEVVKTRGNRKRTYYFLDDDSKDLINRLPGYSAGVHTSTLPEGMKYCRHCYRHLAGYVGVRVTRALVEKNIIRDDESGISVTPEGWEWFEKLGIHKSNFSSTDRLTKQCLDFSERRTHLGGKLGDALLTKMLSDGWSEQVPQSREIRITQKGKQKLREELGITLPK